MSLVAIVKARCAIDEYFPSKWKLVIRISYLRIKYSTMFKDRNVNIMYLLCA